MASLAWTAAALPASQLVLNSAKKQESKGLFDWLSDALDKDALSETDPVLQKVEDKNGSVSGKPKAAPGKKAAPAPQKKGGFFGKK